MNPEHFTISREELEGRLRWYEKQYGPYIRERGLKNWKNLFRKPTLQEWTILIMLILGLFMGWAYQRDVKVCQEFVSEIENNACAFCSNFGTQDRVNEEPPQYNFSGIIINEETIEVGG